MLSFPASTSPKRVGRFGHVSIIHSLRFDFFVSVGLCVSLLICGWAFNISSPAMSKCSSSLRFVEIGFSDELCNL